MGSRARGGRRRRDGHGETWQLARANARTVVETVGCCWAKGMQGGKEEMEGGKIRSIMDGERWKGQSLGGSAGMSTDPQGKGGG